MNLTIQGHQIEVSPAMRAMVIEGLGHLTTRLEQATSVLVHFTGKKKNGWAQCIAIEVRMPGRKVIEVKQYLSREIGSFWASMKTVFRKLARELSEHKTKLKSHVATPARRMQYA